MFRYSRTPFASQLGCINNVQDNIQFYNLHYHLTNDVCEFSIVVDMCKTENIRGTSLLIIIEGAIMICLELKQCSHFTDTSVC